MRSSACLLDVVSCGLGVDFLTPKRLECHQRSEHLEDRSRYQIKTCQPENSL